MTTVPASIPVLRWAALRARLDEFAIEHRFRKWPQWLSGEAQPSLRQLEDFARWTHTPIGYFFLPEPPQLDLPVPDFRTFRDERLIESSTALLDTLYLCQQRQEWYREYSRMNSLPPLDFVGSATLADDPEGVAAMMRHELAFSVIEQKRLSSWSEALRKWIGAAEETGVLVMASSIVGSNSHRKLDVGEFRGFALADNLAPLVFLNAADSKAAQMFTLAHELAHIWLGVSGISDPDAGELPEQRTERWCNHVAAELLMPMEKLRDDHNPDNEISEEIQRLARLFKVSTLVALRRLHDAGFIDQPTLWESYRAELDRIHTLDHVDGGGGGDFYRTLGARTGKRFARAVLSSTLEGQTLFQDAFRMLGVRKTATFYEAVREMGVMQ